MVFSTFFPLILKFPEELVKSENFYYMRKSHNSKLL